jgi:geranylgeranyl pyrophosphate synthase
MRLVAKAVEAVCVGEVEQFEGRGKIPGFKTYLSRISRKTGALFAASCAIGAHLGKMPEEEVKRAARFGGYYGITFQIMDDLLDISKNQAATGKPSGNDLKEGTVTLPVLMAAAKDKELRTMVESYLKVYGKRQMSRKAEEILSRAQRAGAVEDTLAILNRYIAKAKASLEKLPDSPGKLILGEITSLTFKDYIREA